MADKKYSIDDILRKFNKLEESVEDITCFIKDCCSKIPINVGEGFGIFKRLHKGKWEFKSLLAGNNVTITETNNEIVISSTGGGGSFNCNDLLSCSTSNLPEGSNLYFTNNRAISALIGQNISIFNNNSGYITSSALAPYLTSSTAASTYYPLSNPSSYINLTSLSSGTGISYNNLTGVITNSAPDQVVTLTQGGTTTITGTYPNFTISSSDQYTGTVTSVQLSSGTGISLSGTNPITTSGTITVTNTAPDQTVVLSSGTGISTSGTYPNFTITNTAPDQVVTLTQGGTTTITGSYPNFTISSADQYTGTVTSVGLSMPSAFNVANSPVTSSGTLTVTGAGLASQYIRGDGTLADFPTPGGGGGSSITYYLNGSVNQGTFGGNTYYQLSKTAITTAPGTDFTIAANGVIARFITDANDPGLLNIPGGNWNFEMYFSANSNGGSPSFYIEVYKYNGAFTLLASNAIAPEGITNGTFIDSYYTSVSIPNTTLTITDRIAIVVYVNNSGRTITMHTEDTHVSEVITTFSRGLTALNGLTAQVQYFATGTSGTDFNISSSTDTHTFNFPTASATNRGLLSTSDFTTFNNKVTSLSAGTGISIGGTTTVPIVTNTLPDQTVVLTQGGTTTITGTYPNFTISSADQYTGTVTSVAALTLGTTGTDLSSSVANSTTTPVITLNVPTASATNRGALSSTDWSNFNTAYTNRITSLTTTGSSGSATLISNTLNIPTYTLAGLGGIGGSGTTNQIAYFTASTTIGSLTTATYPSLTELSYVKGVTSAIQTQINTKKTTATGNAYKFETTDVSGNLQETTVTPSRAVVTDSNGLPTASATTSTEIGYLSGATSNIQTQINTISAGSKLYLYNNY